MADDPREDPEAVVKAFLQHKGLEQTQDYLVRGRRFTTFDVRQLTKDWITAVRSWLAHKDHTNERNMDDLAAELRLRGLEPPYLAVERELADCSAQTKETERKKVLRAFAREIGEFMRENQRPLH
jgi:hypothetical protein